MVRVKLTMNPTQQILLKRGLNKNGDAQRFFTHEVEGCQTHMSP